MNKKFDTLVFCGRFQPFHRGHESVVAQALEKANEVVIVIGSSFQPRSTKNPFTFEERKRMIQSVFPTHRVKIVGVQDYPYDDNAWVSEVQRAVNSVKTGTNTGLIGHSKDSSSYYLKIFPQWRNHVEVENVEGINATDIREKYLEEAALSSLTSKKITYDFLEPWRHTDTWWNLHYEYKDIKNYKNTWKSAPYEPTFVTTDAVLTQSGYILLIKRGGFPYKNCWALPGGYLAQGHFIEDNMVKELREETCVKIPAKVLRGSIENVKIFDHPDRDPRGRTITHAFHIDLGYPDEKLPRVKAGDDAIHAEWVPLSEITSDKMSFDHYHIIKHFIPTY